MKPVFFSDQQQFRKWLEKNHEKEKELIVGFYKVDSGKPSVTWPQSVDQALCFGWIDGLRKSIDKDSYQIRFTPRKPTSIWSAVNIAKVKHLTEQGLMMPAGIQSFTNRKEEKSKIYSYEKQGLQLSSNFQKLLKADKLAWNYFQFLAPSYKKASIDWVMSAKQQSTQEKRFNEFVKDCKLGINKWKNNKYVR